MAEVRRLRCRWSQLAASCQPHRLVAAATQHCRPPPFPLVPPPCRPLPRAPVALLLCRRSASVRTGKLSLRILQLVP
eukprot:4876249-Prymnesium_polylepis.1